MKPALSAVGAAYVLDVSVHSVNDLVRTGKLKVIYRVGMKRFFNADEVERIRLDRIVHPPSNVYRGVPKGRR